MNEGQTLGTATAKIRLDISEFSVGTQKVIQDTRMMARAQQEAMRQTQHARRMEVEQTRQSTLAQRQQFNQVTAVARASSVTQQQMARSTAQTQMQQARVAANAQIEEMRRATAEHRTQLRLQEQESRNTAQRQQVGRVGGSGFGVMGNVGRFAMGALGIGIGAETIRQVAEYSVEVSKLATSYERQYQSAMRLAGGQQQLTALLDAYSRATGGTVLEADALTSVLSLQATGFANNERQLERFATATRGAAMAMSRPPEQVTFYAQMEILNATGQRLNEIGLSYAEVAQRTEELKESSQGLTEQQIREEAIIGLLIQKYGDLARAPATSIERLTKVLGDLRLETGRKISPVVEMAAEIAIAKIEDERRKLEYWINLTRGIGMGVQNFSTGGGTSGRAILGAPAPLPQNDIPAVRKEIADLELRRAGLIRSGDDLRSHGNDPAYARAIENNIQKINELNALIAMLNQRLGSATTGIGTYQRDQYLNLSSSTPAVRPVGGYSDGQKSLMTDWHKSEIRAKEQAGQRLADLEEQYGDQRVNAAANYARQMVRAEDDFARQRERSTEDHRQRIADIFRDGMRQRELWERDLQRSLASMRADSAERIGGFGENRDERIGDARADHRERLAELEEDYDESVAEARADSLERLVDLEVDFAKRREDAAREFELSRNELSQRLDARGIFNLEARYREQLAKTDEAYQEARTKEDERLDEQLEKLEKSYNERIEREQKSLDKIVAEANKAYDKQLENERKSLEKSIAQQQAAHTQRLADAAAADALRISDMNEDFAERKRLEDDDWELRKQRMNEDHALQLKSIDDQYAKQQKAVEKGLSDQLKEINDAYAEQLAALSNEAEGNKGFLQRRQEEDDKFYKNAEEAHKTFINNMMTHYDKLKRKADLEAERERIVEQMKDMEPTSTDWILSKQRIDAIDNLIKQLGYSAMRTSGVQPIRNDIPMPSAMVDMPRSIGNSNGGNITIGPISIQVHGAPGQSVEDLAGIIDKRIVSSVRRAIGSM